MYSFEVYLFLTHFVAEKGMADQLITNKKDLILAIQQGYGIELENIEFLLRGFGGDCYRVDTQNSASFFLKLHDPISNLSTAASSRAFYLPLMHQLNSKQILGDIPHLIQTLEGGLSLDVGANTLVVSDFIEGELVGFGDLPEPVLVRLAELVGILHNSRPQLEFEHPFIEEFEIVFENELLESFDTLSGLPETASPGQKLVKELILPRQEQITADLEQLKALQTYARNMDKPKVVCHTDLHGGNLMTDERGTLYILDWENALIAPPEHDLFFFAGENDFWELFWPHYTSQYPAASIDPELLRFYFYRRALEDAADFIFRILRGENSPERDQQEIEWMIDCLEGMPQIEGTVAKIREKL
jgi:thiamine kinase-like enzyme